MLLQSFCKKWFKKNLPLTMWPLSRLGIELINSKKLKNILMIRIKQRLLDRWRICSNLITLYELLGSCRTVFLRFGPKTHLILRENNILLLPILPGFVLEICLSILSSHATKSHLDFLWTVLFWGIRYMFQNLQSQSMKYCTLIKKKISSVSMFQTSQIVFQCRIKNPGFRWGTC